MRRLAVVVLSVALLAGCSSAPTDEPTAEPAAVETVTADDIDSMDSGIAWARGLDDSAGAEELSAGITEIGDYFVDEDVWFQTNNEIGQDLLALKVDVLNDPDDAGAKVDDLNLIVDRIEEAIEHGDQP